MKFIQLYTNIFFSPHDNNVITTKLEFVNNVDTVLNLERF